MHIETLTGPLHTWLHECSELWLNATDRRRAALLAAFCAMLFVLVNWRAYHIDVVPLALIPVSVWRHGTVDLDAFRDYYKSLPADQKYPFVESKTHLYPQKPFFVSLLAAPFYLPPILAGVPTTAVDFWISCGRLCAAIYSGMTIALGFLTMRRWGTVAAASWLSLALAFGTCMWTIVGQTLYHHLGAVLCIAGLAYGLRDFPLLPGRAAWAGFLAGAAVCMRPNCVVLLLPLGIFLWFPGKLTGSKARLGALAGVVLMPAFNMFCNHVMYGHWSETGYLPHELNRWTSWDEWHVGALGQLVAPNSGLFVQSPFMLLAVVGGYVVWRSSLIAETGLLRTYSICFIFYWLLLARWYDWQGGLTFSTRMLCESYPLIMPLVMVGWNCIRSRTWAAPALAAAGAWSVFYQLANIATFDKVTTLNPAHEPWPSSRHFFAYYVRQFGWQATFQAVIFTCVQFVLSVLALAYVGRSLLAPAKSGSAQAVDAMVASGDEETTPGRRP